MNARVLLWVAVCATGCGAGPSETVDVDVTRPGVAIADDFLGFSVEWFSIDTYIGDGAGGVRPSVVKLFARFADEGHRPHLRIGGNSQDESWWNPGSLPKPTGVTHDIIGRHLTSLAALQTAVGNQTVLGLNLALGDAANASGLVAAARAAFAPGDIQAFGLGNEPDSFAPRHRPDSYDWPTYLSEVHTFASAVSSATGAPAFLWPSLAGHWNEQLEQQLGSEKGISIVSSHAYPLTVCNGVPPPKPAELLKDYALSHPATKVTPLIKASHAAGLTFRMGEMNSVSCGGGPGASDTYAAALWGADAAMQLAAAGADGLNFHGGAPAGGISHYAPFVIETNGTPTVRPLYYGMRLVSLVTASHGRLLPVTLSPATKVHGYATLGDDGLVRVLLVSLGPGATERFELRVAGSTSASLVRLHAAALESKNGLSLSGQTWDGSTDGTPRGALAPEALERQGDGWLVELPEHDAVVITLRP